MMKPGFFLSAALAAAILLAPLGTGVDGIAAHGGEDYATLEKLASARTCMVGCIGLKANSGHGVRCSFPETVETSSADCRKSGHGTVRKIKRCSRKVLAQMCARRRSGNNQNIAGSLQEPGESHLQRRRVQLRSDV